MTGRMMITLTVATMMAIFFLPALCAAWFRVQRSVEQAPGTAPVPAH